MATFNQSRTNIIRLIMATVFLIILVQLFNLQVLSGKYRPLADKNALFPKVKYPGRGIIFDRKGKAILNNAIMYDLVVIPKDVKAVDTTALCTLLGIDSKEFAKRIRDAMENVIRELKTVTRYLGGTATTGQFTDAIIARLG